MRTYLMDANIKQISWSVPTNNQIPFDLCQAEYF